MLSKDRLKTEMRCNCKRANMTDGTFAGVWRSGDCEMHVQSHCAHADFFMLRQVTEGASRIFTYGCAKCGFNWDETGDPNPDRMADLS